MTLIDIFSGFLGAGKTTFIKKMIAEAYRGEKLVLIENEFGEIGIDGSFLRDQGLAITEINSGCICCSLTGDFTDAITEAMQRWQPDRILIEPSGVGKLTEILLAVNALTHDNPGLQCGNAITIVNPTRLDTYLSSFTEFYRDQIARADMLVLSRTDRLQDARTAEAVRSLREINGTSPIVTTPWDRLTGQQLHAAMQPRQTLSDALCDELLPKEEHAHAHGEHSHHADELFASWSAETPRRFTQAALKTMLDELASGKYGAILRAKGVLPGEDGKWLHFDYMPGEQNVRHGCADVTGRLCVIGVSINPAALIELFGV